MERVMSLQPRHVTTFGTELYGQVNLNAHSLRDGRSRPQNLPSIRQNQYSAASRLGRGERRMRCHAHLLSGRHTEVPGRGCDVTIDPFISTLPRQQRPDRRRMTTTHAAKKTYSSFDEMIEGEEVVLVDFYAVWCGPCQMMNKELQQVALERKGALKVIKIDTEKYPQLASRYGISALPTMMLFRNGNPIDKLEGALSATDLLKRIDAVLATTNS